MWTSCGSVGAGGGATNCGGGVGVNCGVSDCIVGVCDDDGMIVIVIVVIVCKSIAVEHLESKYYSILCGCLNTIAIEHFESELTLVLLLYTWSD